MASRTRERLIDVARQLFARKGIENTTMNDIATASDRGRRTIYTYFRTKSEIYEAVIEEESNRIIGQLEQRVAEAKDPVEKLRALLEFRVELPAGNRRGAEQWIHSLFTREAKREQKVSAVVWQRVGEIIDSISAEGVEQGIFIAEQTARLKPIISTLARGTDLVMPDENRKADESHRRDCIEFVIRAVTKDC